jgi:GNAT superfamily N-acetyltransferase
MEQSFKLAQKNEKYDWQLSKTLIDQELNICFNVYGWQELIFKQNHQTATVQFFPFFSSPETSKLVKPELEIIIQPGFMDFIEEEFKRLDRIPAVCLNQNDPNYKLLSNFFSDKGYLVLPDKDVIMIYKTPHDSSSRIKESSLNLKICKNENDKQVFINIFNKSFFDGDYDAESAYEKATKRSFQTNNNYKVENFIFPSFELNPKMVACASLVTDKSGASKIYVVGVLPEFRKQGLAFSMLQQIIQKWSDLNQKSYLSIETGAGSVAERLYTKLGFERVCLQETWVKG